MPEDIIETHKAPGSSLVFLEYYLKKAPKYAKMIGIILGTLFAKNII